MAKARVDVKKITATEFRGRLKYHLKAAKSNRVVLIENRRQSSKYLVDKQFLDGLLKERESVAATLEILADRKLTERLLSLSETVDGDVAAGRLLKMSDVFGE